LLSYQGSIFQKTTIITCEESMILADTLYRESDLNKSIFLMPLPNEFWK